jgi:hypothetical protein
VENWIGAELRTFAKRWVLRPQKVLGERWIIVAEKCGQECPHHTLLGVAAAEVVDEHLFDGLVVGEEYVADGVTADDVADFFREIFGVISGALERLGHEDDLQAGLAGDVFGILDVAEEDEIAQAVDFGVRSEHVDGLADVAGGEGVADVAEHFFEDRGHVSEVASVVGVDASGGGLGAVGEAEQEVADALEADHELHAGEKFASLGGLYFRDCGGDRAIDLKVEGVEFALALIEGLEQCVGAGGDSFGGGAGGLFGEATGFNGAMDDVVRGLESEAFGASGAHESFPLTGSGGARTDQL